MEYWILVTLWCWGYNATLNITADRSVEISCRRKFETVSHFYKNTWGVTLLLCPKSSPKSRQPDGKTPRAKHLLKHAFFKGNLVAARLWSYFGSKVIIFRWFLDQKAQWYEPPMNLEGLYHWAYWSENQNEPRYRSSKNPLSRLRDD